MMKNKEIEPKEEYDFRSFDYAGDVTWVIVMMVTFYAIIFIIFGVTYLISSDFYKHITPVNRHVGRHNPFILAIAMAGILMAGFSMPRLVKPTHISVEGADVSVVQGKKVTTFHLWEVEKVKYTTSGKTNPTYRVLRIKAGKKKIYIAVRDIGVFHSSEEDRQQIEAFYHFIDHNKMRHKGEVK